MRFNILGGLLPLKPREAVKDVLAGVTLASMNIPQVLGYTRIAGTPIVTGLYTVLLPLVAFALFGSSRHLVVAADSATAAIFSSALSRMAPLSLCPQSSVSRTTRWRGRSRGTSAITRLGKKMAEAMAEAIASVKAGR